jgi:hypothetical protein
VTIGTTSTREGLDYAVLRMDPAHADALVILAQSRKLSLRGRRLMARRGGWLAAHERWVGRDGARSVGWGGLWDAG